MKPKADIEHPTPLVLKETYQPKVTLAPALVKTDFAPEPTAIAKRPLPSGIIAYALYNPTPGIQAYETHFISPDGSNYRRYPLRDVSEPSLHPTENDFPLAIRTWEEKSHPRRLMSSNLEATKQDIVAEFWEDGQPDWSPIENRIIFASQRESDRRWRLYSAWGDGSLEENLQREGRAPTFAPDGSRFAFEGCDNTGNKCGLWTGRLYDKEYGFKLFLENRTAKSPDWSPNTEEIAYMAKSANSWNLYLINSDGSNNLLLTDDSSNDGLPAWSPDGQWLAFVSDRGGSWGLWILHVKSQQLHQVTAFETGSLAAPSRLPYNEHEEHHWWDEQISWGP
jgi:dipeptidyl aminopeptidase/acylaminoacyl peptidase